MSKLWGRACNDPKGILCAKLVHKEIVDDATDDGHRATLKAPFEHVVLR